ncbi:ATP-dependent Clp protease ATP-binding subunit CLPT2, chloroplastic-like isoform X2 [Amaranthus tricolor]|uniref:ATP-dependent Clp protease ATP-binding subunit CLPT2, chloroplastic-like isoform X2 n=1 Tax=Amaranthus tricolor TaxID=29722 RepID=UPI0025848B07|nr:ATP-dependent Clp protease ATP-binding subunit CLPT2, chloroplastic-like isoform X2 [Amaranthus tricolor]
MAASAHSLYRIHFQIPEFTKPKTSSNRNSIPFISLSSLSSQSSILGTFALSFLHPSSRLTHVSPFSSKSRHICATIAFSLPTGTSERVLGDKVPKWSWRAIKSFAMGELEARKLKYPTTGTEALLMGILIEEDKQSNILCCWPSRLENLVVITVCQWNWACFKVFKGTRNHTHKGQRGKYKIIRKRRFVLLQPRASPSDRISSKST